MKPHIFLDQFGLYTWTYRYGREPLRPWTTEQLIAFINRLNNRRFAK